MVARLEHARRDWGKCPYLVLCVDTPTEAWWNQPGCQHTYNQTHSHES